MVNPDGGDAEETTGGAFIGAFMSMGGLLIFALVLALLQDAFNGYLQMLAEGRSAVMENDHYVLIGITDETMAVIQQLCLAHESKGGTVIVILSEQYSKTEMEDKIHNSHMELLGSMV